MNGTLVGETLAVNVSSNKPQVAAVPPSVTVGNGDSAASFPLTTSAVTSQTQVTITASDGVVTKTVTLTVNPVEPPPPPPAALASVQVTPSQVSPAPPPTGQALAARVYLTSAAPVSVFK